MDLVLNELRIDFEVVFAVLLSSWVVLLVVLQLVIVFWSAWEHDSTWAFGLNHDPDLQTQLVLGLVQILWRFALQ